MPHLMVNLDDASDCRRAIVILNRRANRNGVGNGNADKPRGRDRKQDNAENAIGSNAGGDQEDLASLPLPQKLKRIQNRRMWNHLLKIAESAEQPLSLSELDELLDLPKNKMRSLKAIMAKLENRFELKFLRVDADAGEDSSGNPRYIMLPRVRRQILRLAEAT